MIRRRKPLARSSKPLKRSPLKRVAPSFPARSSPIPKRRKGKPRRGPAGIPASEWRCKPFRDFLAAEGKCRPCQVAIERLSKKPVTWSLYHYRAALEKGHCDPAHGPVNGASSKGPDSGCIPLCRGFDLPSHHDEQHAIGWPAFEAKYGIDREREAAAHWRLFRILDEAK